MRLRLGGVPEHFNYLWQLADAKEILRHYGVVYEWTNYPGGTGAIASALLNNEIDMAIMLTEGAIAAIADDKPFHILFPFVMSPLLWGVFSNAKREKPLPKNYSESKFAISRYNSGSHLMAKFLAQREKHQLTEFNFQLSQDLQGARENLLNGTADYFLWEKYMTRPLIHSGEFIQNDEVSAPWPSFVFVVKKDFHIVETEVWKQAVYELSSEFLLASKQELIAGISQTFGLTASDTENWLDEVKYYDNNNYWMDRITAAVIIMHSKGMIKRQPGLDELIA
jgi:sulfonate transport system substrate-binding protein